MDPAGADDDDGSHLPGVPLGAAHIAHIPHNGFGHLLDMGTLSSAAIQGTLSWAPAGEAAAAVVPRDPAQDEPESGCSLDGPHFGHVETFSEGRTYTAISAGDGKYLDVPADAPWPATTLFVVIKNRLRQAIKVNFLQWPLARFIQPLLGETESLHSPSSDSSRSSINEFDMATILSAYERLRAAEQSLPPDPVAAHGVRLLLRAVLLDPNIFAGIDLTIYQNSTSARVPPSYFVDLRNAALGTGLAALEQSFYLALVPDEVNEQTRFLEAVERRREALSLAGDLPALKTMCEPLLSAGAIQFQLDRHLLVTLLHRGQYAVYEYYLGCRARSCPPPQFWSVSKPGVDSIIMYDPLYIAILLDHQAGTEHFWNAGHRFEGYCDPASPGVAMLGREDMLEWRPTGLRRHNPLTVAALCSEQPQLFDFFFRALDHHPASILADVIAYTAASKKAGFIEILLRGGVYSALLTRAAAAMQIDSPVLAALIDERKTQLRFESWVCTSSRGLPSEVTVATQALCSAAREDYPDTVREILSMGVWHDDALFGAARWCSYHVCQVLLSHRLGDNFSMEQAWLEVGALFGRRVSSSEDVCADAIRFLSSQVLLISPSDEVRRDMIASCMSVPDRDLPPEHKSRLSALLSCLKSICWISRSAALGSGSSAPQPLSSDEPSMTRRESVSCRLRRWSDEERTIRSRRYRGILMAFSLKATCATALDALRSIQSLEMMEQQQRYLLLDGSEGAEAVVRLASHLRAGLQNYRKVWQRGMASIRQLLEDRKPPQSGLEIIRMLLVSWAVFISNNPGMPIDRHDFEKDLDLWRSFVPSGELVPFDLVAAAVWGYDPANYTSPHEGADLLALFQEIVSKFIPTDGRGKIDPLHRDRHRAPGRRLADIQDHYLAMDNDPDNETGPRRKKVPPDIAAAPEERWHGDPGPGPGPGPESRPSPDHRPGSGGGNHRPDDLWRDLLAEQPRRDDPGGGTTPRDTPLSAGVPSPPPPAPPLHPYRLFSPETVAVLLLASVAMAVIFTAILGWRYSAKSGEYMDLLAKLSSPQPTYSRHCVILALVAFMAPGSVISQGPNAGPSSSSSSSSVSPSSEQSSGPAGGSDTHSPRSSDARPNGGEPVPSRLTCPHCHKTFGKHFNRNKHVSTACPRLREDRARFACRNGRCERTFTTEWYRGKHEAMRCRFRPAGPAPPSRGVSWGRAK